jgi:hypothetical protein
MKRLFLLFITMLLFLFASCNSDFFISGKFDKWNASNPSPVIPPAGEKAGNGTIEPAPAPDSDPATAPVDFFCGEWSDINNYDFYKNLSTNTNSCFTNYIGYFGFETRYMVTVNVASGVNPVCDVLVELYYSNDKLFSAKTNLKGNAYLFPSEKLNGKNITIKVNGVENPFLPYDGNPIHITLTDDAAKISTLDLMFVVDATSSMGDELLYLKYKYSNIIGRIKEANPEYAVNLALLFYRDTGDEYVTRYFDFTGDVTQQQKNLDKQSASGGGDFPEAVDRALAEAVDKDINWSDSAVRFIFHVCDAPPHSDQISQSTYYDAVKTAAQKGIRIIQIASNGIDIAAEYLLRQEAIMTGGTYIFLTDYTGKDESELLHTVGAYDDENLNDCIVRVVNKYLKGN